MQDLVCISHLRWEFVWQRPQHILSRLAKQYRLFFVEEPVTNTEIDAPRIESFPGRGAPGVTVMRLLQPAQHHYWIGHSDPQTQTAYGRLLAQELAAQGVEHPILWLYTPMALPFVDALQPSLLVYDVMDELSAFDGAPVQLREMDRTALAKADLVFTGGASLYRARADQSSNIHLFPSGVEIAHFAQATEPDIARPRDLEGIERPILGYFGVIDERMDLPLLAYLAESHPEWQIVMLGPVVKIDAAWLPQAPNLHYLGMKDYNELPRYLARFDVALVPFAMNAATRYLSPTKTLEYLAAAKPVVSTPIPDIIELYGDYVRVAYDPETFVAEVEAALAESPAERQLRAIQVRSLLERSTWDHIAGEMGNLIERELQHKTTQKRAEEGVSPSHMGTAASQSPSRLPANSPQAITSLAQPPINSL